LRFQGKLTNWNDDKGYGFVEPNGGGDRCFVHIKSFQRKSRRPVDGGLIIYEQVKEAKGKY
jgi:cold shock CspA family protein